MHQESFGPVLDSILGTSPPGEFAERFAAGLQQKTFQAKELVFEEGDQTTCIIFVMSGYLRLYVTDENGDISTRFLAGPNDFAGCVMSTLYDSDAMYTAECITDCELVLINASIIDEAKSHAKARLVMQDLIIKRLFSMMQEKAMMLPLKATDRYLLFRERHARLIKHVPSGIIANYLGLRPQSLSRIKQMLK